MGYKIHLACDGEAEMPLASTVVEAVYRIDNHKPARRRYMM
jgi:hypothetical protein